LLSFFLFLYSEKNIDGKAKRKRRRRKKSVISIFTGLYNRLIFFANRSNDRKRKLTEKYLAELKKNERERNREKAAFLSLLL
jgi:hypothetical protein